ncbi:MAG: DUF4239 domain-containing protein [Rhodobacteraceae bacterium]|nr:DUF4239 domain-containing protein [Paracoccaceae bacterium]
MNPTVYGPAFAVALFIGMLLTMEAGYRLGSRRRKRDPEGAQAGIGAVNGAVFGLLGLLVAFTFSGAATRFDERRHLIVEEANCIGTAWLRVDLLPVDEQPGIRDLFRRYLDSRLETYQMAMDIEGAEAEYAGSVRLQNQIWQRAVAACEVKQDSATKALVLGALNAMIDISTTRVAATRIHPPVVIFSLLFGLGLGCSFLAGYGMAGGKTRNWTHKVGFAGVLALSVYVIIELEYPRLGLIRVDATDQLLLDLRKSMD